MGISRYKPLYVEWINNRVLLYTIENYIQYPVISHNEKECEKLCVCVYVSRHVHMYALYMCMYICMYVCVYMNHFAVHGELTQHFKSTIPQLNTFKKLDPFTAVHSG